MDTNSVNTCFIRLLAVSISVSISVSKCPSRRVLASIPRANPRRRYNQQLFAVAVPALHVRVNVLDCLRYCANIPIVRCNPDCPANIATSTPNADIRLPIDFCFHQIGNRRRVALLGFVQVYFGSGNVLHEKLRSLKRFQRRQ